LLKKINFSRPKKKKPLQRNIYNVLNISAKVKQKNMSAKSNSKLRKTT